MTNSNTPISASTGQPKSVSPASNPQQGNQQQNQGKPQQNQGGNKPNTDKPAGQPQQK